MKKFPTPRPNHYDKGFFFLWLILQNCKKFPQKIVELIEFQLHKKRIPIFLCVTKNIKDWLKIFISYLVHSQIWLNLRKYDCHFRFTSFAMYSPHIPITFSICCPHSSYVPQHVPNSSSCFFYPICFGKCCPNLMLSFYVYRWAMGMGHNPSTLWTIAYVPFSWQKRIFPWWANRSNYYTIKLYLEDPPPHWIN
jgi:hypothetical protein